MEERFVIALEENPTTGYVWEAVFDRSMIEQLGKDHHRANSSMGAGGTTEFTFQAMKKGTTRIVFRLARPWEGVAVKTADFEIVVS